MAAFLMHAISPASGSLGSSDSGGSETGALDHAVYRSKRRSTGTRALQERECAAGGDIANAGLSGSSKRSRHHASRPEAQGSQQRGGHKCRRGNHAESETTEDCTGREAPVLRSPFSGLWE